MQKPASPVITRICTFTLLLWVAVFAAGCSKPASTSTATTTIEVNRTIFPQNTATDLPDLPTPTATKTVIPTVGTPDPTDQSGLIVFAMGDGQYKHLFVYHPSYLPITRLTADPWNFDFPAISPDGTKIAYCADQYGKWDIFILDLVLNQTERLTESESYTCAPSWSPDGQWLAVETYQDGRFDILILPVNKEAADSIKLTENSGNNFSPAWSPNGREVAFVTDRNGRDEIWIARLDNPEDRFIITASSTGADFSSPNWSPDGNSLAWSKSGEQPTIEVIHFSAEGSSVISLGTGTKPVWLPDGSGVLSLLVLPNEYDFVAYESTTARLLLPPIPLSEQVSAFDWKSAGLAKNIAAYLARVNLPEPASLWQPRATAAGPQVQTNQLVEVSGITAPEPYLSDAVIDRFQDLRAALTEELGWDYLEKLENASLSLDSLPPSNIAENWLYTGRAIATNQIPLEAGWMAVSREDYNGKTYWRVWLKCYAQDGSCGTPVRAQSWDFSARYSADITALENGGKENGTLQGYWIDFTEFASRYGWERIPSNSDWRSYFSSIQLNVFVLRESLSWLDAMLQLYPPEKIQSFVESST